MTYVGVFLLTLLMLIYRIEVTLGQKCSTTEGKEQKDYSRDTLISVIPNTAGDIDFMRQLDRKEIVDLWGEAQPAIGAKKLMRVSRGRLKAVMTDLKNRNMKAIIVSYNLQKLIKQNFDPHMKMYPMKLGAKNFNFNQYHPYKNIEFFLKDFTNMHKDVCKLEVFGKSYENRPMYVVKISSSNIGNIFSKNRKDVKGKTKNKNTGCGRQRCQKKIIFIDCGIHAREWASISFCLYFLKYLITGYKENKRDFKTILTKYDFIIIPVMNPDGYVYTHEKDRLWRKTRSKNPGSRCVGVDANRNFYSSSEKCENHNPCSEIYCGRKPFSEPETVALRDLLKRTAGKVKGYFDIHCYGQYWLIPWGKYKWRPKNYCEMERVAAVGVKAAAKRHRTKFTFGQVTKVMYAALGAAIDYVYEKGYANYSYALELRDKGDCDTGQCGFLLPADKIQPTCEETTDGVVAAILAMK